MKTVAQAIPQHIDPEQAEQLVELAAATDRPAQPCCVCHEEVDVAKPCAWWDGGKTVAHLKCYDGAWFTVGVADRIEARS